MEPVILWMAICMPTEMGKSLLCKYLRKLVQKVETHCGVIIFKEISPKSRNTLWCRCYIILVGDD